MKDIVTQYLMPYVNQVFWCLCLAVVVGIAY
jgi:hypothetical protein